MDVIRLLSEGWEMEWTDKGYKLYLNPPGTRAVRRQAQAALQRGADPLKAYHPVFQTWSPAPPVKVYLQHLDDDHRTRAENAAQSYRATEAATS